MLGAQQLRAIIQDSDKQIAYLSKRLEALEAMVRK